LEHPEVAYRTCKECQQWFYDPKTGQRSMRFGQPLPRKPTDPRPNCRGCPKCQGLPLDQQNPKAGSKRTLSTKNWRTLEFYYEVQAVGVGDIKLDAMARRNMGLIARTLAEYERIKGVRLSVLLQLLANRPGL